MRAGDPRARSPLGTNGPGDVGAASRLTSRGVQSAAAHAGGASTCARRGLEGCARCANVGVEGLRGWYPHARLSSRVGRHLREDVRASRRHPRWGACAASPCRRVWVDGSARTLQRPCEGPRGSRGDVVASVRWGAGGRRPRDRPQRPDGVTSQGDATSFTTRDDCEGSVFGVRGVGVRRMLNTPHLSVLRSLTVKPVHEDLTALEGVVAPKILQAARLASARLTSLGVRHALVGASPSG